jgi:hypothetical protein
MRLDSQSARAAAICAACDRRRRKLPAATSDLGASWVSGTAPNYLGIVEAPTERAAAAVAVAQFSLTEEHRRRLVVQEHD